ncbi:MAG: hypothetical protein FJ146_03650 [Deltaproteobacteria bacterium]|nr:hypothetical protein [Deltaproteobacteria bacterium]
MSNSVFLDRTGNGDTAKIQFKTSADALCKLAIYAQDPSRTPTESAPTMIRCSSPNEPRQAFVESISGLRQDTLYYVNIFSWLPSQKEGGATVLRVRETADVPSMVVGDPNGSMKSLMIARLDVPLKAAEIFRHQPTEAFVASTVKTQIMQPMGCHQGLPQLQNNFRHPDPNVAIQNLVTRDFAAANAKSHLEYGNRLQLSYGSVNVGMNRWTLLFQNGGTDVEVPVQPINQLLSVEVESKSIISLENPSLLTPVEVLAIDSSKPLKFSWTVGNTLLDPSYFIVQIGNLNNSGSLYCVFNANTGTAMIEPEMLQKLEDGSLDLQAKLITNQLKVKEGWLITITDWRMGRLTK